MYISARFYVWVRVFVCVCMQIQTNMNMENCLKLLNLISSPKITFYFKEKRFCENMYQTEPIFQLYSKNAMQTWDHQDSVLWSRQNLPSKLFKLR